MRLIKNYLNLIRSRTYQQNWNAMKYAVSNRTGIYKNANLIYEPIHVSPIITYKCNLRCSFCQLFESEPKTNEKCQDMSFSLYRKILHRFKGALSVGLGGGEPFLHKEVVKMIEYGLIYKKSVSLNTNGTLLSNRIDQVISSTPTRARLNLRISLNAYNEIEYQKINNAPLGTFDEVLQTIMKLVDKRSKENKKIQLGISYVCTKENYDALPDMVKLADDLGVDSVYFINLQPIGKDGYTEEHCLYDDDEDVIEVIKSLEKSQFNIEVTGPNLYNRKFVKQRSHCLQPFSWITIDQNGDVYTCCRLKVLAGNLFSNYKVWNNNVFQNFRHRMISADPSIIPNMCKTCATYFDTY